MPTIKQKTVGGDTYELKRYRTERGGKQFEYYVTENGKMVDDPVFTRREGMAEFRATIEDIRRAKGNDRNRARGPSLPNLDSDPDGPSLPGFGPVDTDGDGDNNDDDQPFLPGF